MRPQVMVDIDLSRTSPPTESRTYKLTYHKTNDKQKHPGAMRVTYSFVLCSLVQ